MMLWGIDLGGTKLEGVVVSAERPTEPLCRVRLPTGAEHGYHHILEQIERLCRELETQSGQPRPLRIGLGTPGILDPQSQRLKNANTQCLNGQALREDLFRRLPVDWRIANDANCFALAEAQLGAGRGYPVVFGAIIGTGVGGGLVVNGTLLPGRHGIAGEWGQLVLDSSPAAPLSNYGTRGTIEAMLAGPALERFYASRHGQERTLREIAARSETDPDATATLARLEEWFPRALARIIHVLDPDAIIIGGGVGNLDLLYTEAMRARISQEIFHSDFQAALVKPLLGDSAGVFGAALLAQPHGLPPV